MHTHPDHASAPGTRSSLFKAAALAVVFLGSLFPLHPYFPHLRRAHAWAPQVGPAGFFLWAGLSAAVALVCAAACHRVPEAFAATMSRWMSAWFAWRPVFFIGGMSLAVLCATSLASWFLLGHIPHVQDSIAQLFQAKIFASGAVSARPPLHSEFFQYINIILTPDRWHSQYPPGQALLLVPALLAGVPWALNPVLGAVTVVLVYLLAKRCYGSVPVAYLGVTLLCLSPFFIFMSSNFMSHTPVMFFGLLFILLYVKTSQHPSAQQSFLCGCALGAALTIRPLTAAALCTPFLVDCCITAVRKRGTYLLASVLLGLGISVFAGLLLWYNDLTNGAPLIFGYAAKHRTLGFLGAAQFGPPHTLAGGFVNTSNNLVALNDQLFQWPVPSLVFVFALFLPWARRNRWDRLFAASCLTLAGSYFFYFYQDLCFGPRFYFSAVPLLAILSARGILAVPSMLSRSALQTKAAACLYALLAVFTAHMLIVRLPGLIAHYCADYWYVSSRAGELVKRQGIHNAVIFVDVSIPRGTAVPNLLAYGDGFVHNDPDLSGDVIYAMDLGSKNIDLMKAFPDRSFYVLTYDPPATNFMKTAPQLIPMDEDSIGRVSTGTDLDISRSYVPGRRTADD